MRTDPLSPNRLRKAARVALRAGSDPLEVVDKVSERAASRWEGVRRRGQATSYRPDRRWEEHLHELLGEPWPCPLTSEFDQVWAGISETMRSRGLQLGRLSYGGHDDADQGLARTMWCLTRHLGPDQAVETGVGHGISTRCIVEALDRNGRGRLCSIDLPPLTIPERRGEIAAALPSEQRERWSYLEGSSRRRLPRLLRDLGEIQLFLHDSWHSTRNTRWELARAWRALTPGGVMVADDIDHNFGFELFGDSVDGADTLCCTADDGQRMFGVVRKRV